MQQELQKKIITECPWLYKHFRNNPQAEIECTDDLFEFIFEVSRKIEDFNRRFPARKVRALKVAMEYGELVFLTNKQVFTVKKLIVSTASQIKSYRRDLKKTLLKRAKAIQTTALFESRLLPDWKYLMPDDTDTLRKILEYAAKCAVVPQDHVIIETWSRRFLNKDGQNNFFDEMK